MDSDIKFFLKLCVVALIAAVGVIALIVWIATPTQRELTDQRHQINDQLPEACRFVDLGQYKGATVTAVICDGTPTTTRTSSRLVSSGKTTQRVTEHTVVIGAF